MNNDLNHPLYKGKLADEYDIYLANTDDNYPKSFDEWLED